MIHPKILTGKGAVAPLEMESKMTPLTTASNRATI